MSMLHSFFYCASILTTSIPLQTAIVIYVGNIMFLQVDDYNQLCTRYAMGTLCVCVTTGSMHAVY